MEGTGGLHQGTACNPPWHIWHRQSTIIIIIINIITILTATSGLEHHKDGALDYTLSYTTYTVLPRSTMSNVANKHTHSQKTGTTDYTIHKFNYGVCRQQSTTMQNSTPKLAGQNPESISQEAIYHGILARTLRYQVVEKLLWKPSEDASQMSS